MESLVYGSYTLQGKDGIYILDQENQPFTVFWMMISLPKQWEEAYQ